MAYEELNEVWVNIPSSNHPLFAPTAWPTKAQAIRNHNPMNHKYGHPVRFIIDPRQKLGEENDS